VRAGPPAALPASVSPENFFDPILDPVRSEPGYSRVLPGLGRAK
jgi:hypothetical protein